MMLFGTNSGGKGLGQPICRIFVFIYDLLPDLVRFNPFSLDFGSSRGQLLCGDFFFVSIANPVYASLVRLELKSSISSSELRLLQL